MFFGGRRIFSYTFNGTGLAADGKETHNTEKTMRTFKVSDQLYEQLKNFVVDPFDDTPENVIGRLIEIVNKAKGRWCPFEEDEPEPEGSCRQRQPFHEEEPVVVL